MNFYWISLFELSHYCNLLIFLYILGHFPTKVAIGEWIYSVFQGKMEEVIIINGNVYYFLLRCLNGIGKCFLWNRNAGWFVLAMRACEINCKYSGVFTIIPLLFQLSAPCYHRAKCKVTLMSCNLRKNKTCLTTLIAIIPLPAIKINQQFNQVSL